MARRRRRRTASWNAYASGDEADVADTLEDVALCTGGDDDGPCDPAPAALAAAHMEWLILSHASPGDDATECGGFDAHVSTAVGVFAWRVAKERRRYALEFTDAYAPSTRASYVVLDARSRDLRRVFHWRGRDAPHGAVATAAYKAVELNRFLGGEGKTAASRELQGEESPEFAAAVETLERGGDVDADDVADVAAAEALPPAPRLWVAEATRNGPRLARSPRVPLSRSAAEKRTLF